MQKIRSMEEYKDLINETLYDLEDLRASIEYDEEFMEEAMELVNPLTEQLKALLAEIDTGTYASNGTDLAFMNIVNKTSINILPCRQMFQLINATHKHGFST